MSDTKEVNIDELIPDDRNANRGNEEGQQLIERSFKAYGAGRSVLLDKDGRLIAGNKSHDAAKKAGIKKVRVIETTGDELIAVKRTDISLDSKEGREMAIADNATAKANIEFDFVVLDELEEEHGIEMESWGIQKEQEAEKSEKKTYEITPYELTHVLLSFPPHVLPEIEEYLKAIKQNDQVDYEQSSN